MISKSDRRSIGLLSCVALTSGHIIGTGIFSSPTAIIRKTQSIGMSLCIWLVAGLVSSTGAFTYSEIASTFDRSGGDPLYLNFIGWRALAFFFVITQIFIIYPTIACLQALAFAQYFAMAVGLRNTNFYVNFGIAAVMTICLLVANIFLKSTSMMKLNIAMAGIKIGTLVFIVILSLIAGNTANLSDPFQNSVLDPDSIIESFYNAFFAFEGYDISAVIVEEVVYPERNLPLAVSISLTIAVVLFAAVNVAFCLVLGKWQMMQMDAAMSLNRFAQLTLGPQSLVIPLLISLNLINSLNMTIFGASRIVHAAARANLLPGCLSGWNLKRQNPPVAYCLPVIIIIVGLLLFDSSSLYSLNESSSIAQWLQHCTTAALVIYIRLSRISVKKTIYRSNFLCLCLYFCCLSTVLISSIVDSWILMLLTLGTFLVSSLFYWPFSSYYGLQRLDKYKRLHNKLGDITTQLMESLFRCESEATNRVPKNKRQSS
ncbi:CRE-AAT-6 protein [Aphelenchoides besseyi]|nr:CRE-AAT-6 protein [Aphelenchoides besseyi]